MQLSTRTAAAIAAIIVTVISAVTLFAQADGVGSLGELTAEVRLLRTAIEQSSRTQTQAQALGIFLSAQHSRIVQVTARLDAARRELEGFAQQSREHANALANLDAAIPQVADPAERLALEDRSKGLKFELKNNAEREQQARMREAEMLQAWQQEEARWNDLIARLQEIVQR